MLTTAFVKQGGFLSPSTIIITKTPKNGEERTESYVGTNVKWDAVDGKIVLTFVPSASSFGMTSKGTISGRRYLRPKSIVVDSIETEDKHGERKKIDPLSV